MDYVADVLYGRAAKRAAEALRRALGVLLRTRGTSQERYHGRHWLSRHSNCRSWSRFTRRSKCGGILEQRKGRPIQHQRSHARPLGSDALLRSRSQRAG